MNFSKDQLKALQKELKKDGVQKIAVGAVIFRRRSVLLLKRREDDSMGGIVELPSGGVDAGEGVMEALRRETAEETGLKIVSVDTFLGTFDYLSSSGKKCRQLNFLVSVSGREIKLNPDEHTDYYWLNPTSANWQSFNISKEVERIVNWAFNLID